MGTIDGVGGTAPARSGWGRSAPAGDGFAVPNGPAQSARPVAAGAASGVLLETMLTLQAAARPEERSRQALRQGHELLRRLAGLQAALLGREFGETELESLATLCDQIETPPDPALAGILSAIRLRAKVELARLGRRSGGVSNGFHP